MVSPATNADTAATTESDEAVAHETSLFESFTAIPVVSGAVLVRDPSHSSSSKSNENNSLTMHVTTSARDLATDGVRSSTAAVPLGREPPNGTLIHPAFGVEERGVLVSSISPSGEKRLVVRDAKSAGGDRGAGIVFEIWEGGMMVSETLVPPSTHGNLCTDGTFGGVSWSALEQRIAYVAEAPEDENRTPEWGMGVTSNASKASDKEKKDDDAKPKDSKKSGWRGRGEWREDWGEQLVGKIEPAVFIFETELGKISKVKGMPEGSIAASGPTWAPISDDAEKKESSKKVNLDSTQLVCAAWSPDIDNFKSTSRRLGLVFCFNRPAGLWLVQVGVPDEGDENAADETADAIHLTADTRSALWPRFSPDGKSLLYVSHERAVVTGAHAATASLRVIAWDKALTFKAQGERFATPDDCSKYSRDVLGVDGTSEKKSLRGSFPGLYASSPLVVNPWISDDSVVLQSTWGVSEAVLRVDISTGEITRLTPPATEGEGAWIGENNNTDENEKLGGSWILADVKDGIVVAICSSPSTPPEAQVLWLPSNDAHYNAELLFTGWHTLHRPIKSPVAQSAMESIANLEYFTQDVSRSIADNSYLLSNQEQEKDEKSSGKDSIARTVVQSIVVRRKGVSKNAPLVILPHGGPHGACVAGWAGSVAFLASLGYVVAYCNYRGSTGYGESALQSLLKCDGSDSRSGAYASVRDVHDCVAIAKRCINDGLVDESKVCVVGGSHGGFLGGHLVGQEFIAQGVDFKCAVLRNPVTDIAGMVFSTDIPDWCFVETVGILDYTDNPSVETLQVMREKSPIAHVRNVARKNAPVLMLIGAIDLRVPPTNGLRYAAALREAGGTCDVRLFPEDSHGLGKPRTEFESFVTIAKFLRENLQIGKYSCE